MLAYGGDLWLVADCDRRGMIVDVTLSRGKTEGAPARLPPTPLGSFLRHYATEGHGKANQWGDGPWIFYVFDHRCLSNVEDYDGVAITVPKGATNLSRIEEEFFATVIAACRQQ
jgi:hypothetical protein